jgi:shikimate dehydrogenase
MPRLGVLGWPVAHSLSPSIHNAALAALGMRDWRYQRLPVPPALFSETVRALGGAGFIGANVTIPHKLAAGGLADELSDAAREIGAANTLTFAPDGTIAAENTDAPGLIAAIARPVSGLRALVLGAGGSARAAVWALRKEGADVLVWNRTPARAQALARELGARSVSAPGPADVLVNCTSVGLEEPPGGGEVRTADERSAGVQPSAKDVAELNQLGLTFDQVAEYSYVVELVYRADPTALLSAARAHDVHTVDGREVLVAQGALSLELWTGRPAPLEVMRRAASAPDAAR